MKLSTQTRRALARAANSFADEVARIVAKETSGDVIDQLRSTLDQLDGRTSKPGGKRPKRAPRKKSARSSRSRPTQYDKLIPQLVTLLEHNGGTVAPGKVSKAFGLSPEQRRNLVAKAKAKGLVKVSGVRRSTTYSLAKGGSGSGRGASKKTARRRPRKKATRGRKR